MKASLSYHQHQAKVIEEQEKLIEAQAADITALKEEIVALRRTNHPADLEQRTPTRECVTAEYGV